MALLLSEPWEISIEVNDGPQVCVNGKDALFTHS